MSIEFYKDGKLEGNRKVFYKDGTIAEDTNYKAGIKEGTSKTYSDKGKLIDEHIYKNGQYEGLASYYDGNGSKMYEGNYVNGKRVGNWKFFENNKVIKEVKAAKFSKELIKYDGEGVIVMSDNSKIIISKNKKNEFLRTLTRGH